MTEEADLGRRRTARIVFHEPRKARFGNHDVFIIDLSLHGVGVRHQSRIALGQEGVIRFRLERQEHEVGCRLIRSKLEILQSQAGQAQAFRSGLEFVGHKNEAASVKEAMMKRVRRAFLLQQANALSKPELMNAVSDPSTQIDIRFLAPWLVPKPFVRCTMDAKGRWKVDRVNSAEQPDEGFTLLAGEGDAEIEKLRKAWEISDAEQRRLIQLFAHLSLTETSDSRKGRYEP